MKKICKYLPVLLLMIFTFAGCNTIGTKSMSISVIYAATTILSLALLIVYCCFIDKKNSWFLLLFSSVFIINAGYFSLSVSTVLEEALLANRIAYLGSVFLPMSMLMLILNTCNLKYKKWFSMVLMCISLIVFLIAASPGYLDIYYKSVSLRFIDDVAVLDKVYGSLHSVYLYYLIAYFAFMIGVIVYSYLKKKIKSNMHSAILLVAVFVNIGVWLLEQLVDLHIEFLSVSYIFTEFFLIIVNLMYKEDKTENLPGESESNLTLKSEKEMNNQNSNIQQTEQPSVEENPFENKKSAITENDSELQQFMSKCEYFREHLDSLTPTERTVYELYLDKKTTKEIMDILHIKENTLKYHNKNIYSKLGVSSRKQLIEIATALRNQKSTKA